MFSRMVQRQGIEPVLHVTARFCISWGFNTVDRRFLRMLQTYINLLSLSFFIGIVFKQLCPCTKASLLKLCCPAVEEWKKQVHMNNP